MGRIGLAFRCFFRVLRGRPVPEEALVEQEGQKPSLPAPAVQELDRGRALQLLGLLQKEGRLLDFLQEDIQAYTDQQIGAAVRSIHQECRKVLEEHIQIEPVLEGAEDSRITVDTGFDPSTIRLLGNVTGEPPFSGVLRHHGWRAKQISLPGLPTEGDKSVIAPAEVELS